MLRVLAASVLLVTLTTTNTTVAARGVGFMQAEPQAASDTVRISMVEFIRIGMDASGLNDVQLAEVETANLRVQQARANRILPRITLQTQHGLVPGVISDSVLSGGAPLPPGQYYLDPNLTNDWTDWAIFTRAQIESIQPIWTWGAINTSIKAAEFAAVAAYEKFKAEQVKTERSLAELYLSYVFSLEVERLVQEAEDQIQQVDRRIREMQEEGNPDLKESDIFKYEIFLSEFAIQKEDVLRSREQINRIWAYVTRQAASPVQPARDELNPLPLQLEPFDTYLDNALAARAEVKAADAGVSALRNAVEVLQTEAYPSVFLGLSASYAITPNRPKQDNPFINNSTNYASARFGFGVQQNLNFLTVSQKVEKGRIDARRAEDLRSAVQDGIVLEVSEAYKQAALAQAALTHTEKALVTTKNWVRHEQLNYDYGFGDVKELVDSMKKELELRVDVKTRLYEWNLKLMRLYVSSGIPLNQLESNP